MRIALVLLVGVVVSGCAQYRWVKQGASDSDFAQDRYACERESAAMYPPAMVQQQTSPGFVAPPPRTVTNCQATGYGQVNCTSQQQGAMASIYNQPPTYAAIDANGNARVEAWRSCLVARGYRKERE